MVAKNKLTNAQDTLLYVGLQIGSYLIARMVAKKVKTPKIDDDNDEVKDNNDQDEKTKSVNTIDVLLRCVGIRVLRQCFWKIALYRYNLGSFSFEWAAFDIFQDCLSIYLASRGEYDKWSLMKQIGSYLFIFGSFMETTHDIHRNMWLSNPENKGKVYQKLWSKFIIYPNYCGYWIWNTGRGLITGNLIFAAITSIFHFYNFQSNSIARVHAYSLERYGKEYEEYIAKTPKMIPFVF